MEIKPKSEENSLMQSLDVYDQLINLRNECRKLDMRLSGHMIDAAAESVLDVLNTASVSQTPISQSIHTGEIIPLSTYRKR